MPFPLHLHKSFAFETLIRPLLLPAKTIPDNGKQQNNINHYSGLSDSSVYFEWMTSTVILVHQKLYLYSSIYLLKGLFGIQTCIKHTPHVQWHQFGSDTQTKMCGWMLRSWGQLLYREAVFCHLFDVDQLTLKDQRSGRRHSCELQEKKRWPKPTRLSGTTNIQTSSIRVQVWLIRQACVWCYEFIFNDLSFLRRTVGIEFLHIIYRCKRNFETYSRWLVSMSSYKLAENAKMPCLPCLYML